MHSHLAHDLRNRLLPVLLGLERAIEHGDPSRLPEALRAARQMQTMLNEHRQTVPIELNEFALLIARRELPGIELMVLLDGAQPCALADPVELHTAMNNLLDNAEEALRGGVLNARIAIVTKIENGLVSIGVGDNGPGIEPEKLREGYSSQPGAGHGLGLASVREKVAASGGELRIESVPGNGAVFTICLPRA